jgi:putative ABC transport system permease protein
MLRNNIRSGIRNLWKTKTFSTINIVGLSLGIAAFLLILAYLRFEYSYEDFQAKKDRIYRLPMEISEKGEKVQTFAFTYPAAGPALVKDYPEVETMARFRRQGGVITQGEIKLLETGAIYFADKSLFTIFSFPFEKGNASAVFTQLNEVVLTESTAKKYFGNADPMQKTIRYQKEDYVVTGILKDLPANSHLQFAMLFNYDKYVQIAKSFGGDAENSWGWSDYYTYILLKPGVDVKALQKKMAGFAEKHMGRQMKEKGFQVQFKLQPVTDIHLRSTYDYELPGNGNLGYLKYLGIAAFMIILIAWINYVNLSTARALDRSHEVGIRKAIGASRRQLVFQFLTESVIVNIISVAIGVLLYILFLPYLTELLEKTGYVLRPTSLSFWMYILGFFLLGTLIAGFYPSFILSSFQPVRALKNDHGASTGMNRNLLRKSLVVLQFTAAIILITGAIGYYRQLIYMSKRDLGVNIDQTLILFQNVQQDSSKLSSISAFTDELKRNKSVVSVTSSTCVPGQEVNGSSSFTLGKSPSEKRCRVFGIDDYFIPDYKLQLLAGRNFSTDSALTDNSKSANIIVNETAAKVFGFNKPEDILNKDLYSDELKLTVVGVLKDYHQESLKNNFDPIVFYPETDLNRNVFSIKLQSKNYTEVLESIKKIWSARFPDSPFNFTFLDERFNAQYKNDRQFSAILWWFTALAIVVAGLGLFGLSLYTIAKRKKEISIRKVLGADMLQIIALTSKDYIKLVFIAGILAVPVAWKMLSNWLEQYAFQIPVNVLMFLVPFILILAIAAVTISFQSVRAALTNPVKNLRTE